MTGDEMQRAIDFLLKSQANFEKRFEEWELRIESRFEDSDRRIESRFEDSDRRFELRLEESDRRFELHVEETKQQFFHVNQILESLADMQSQFTQTVLGFITMQVEFNTSTQKRFDEMTGAQQRMQQEISDLTKAINNFMRFSSGNGNSPQDS